MNLAVSDELRERSYRMLSTLFNALEHLGYSVDIKTPNSNRYYADEPHVNDNVTYVNLGSYGVPVSLRELQRRVPHEPTKEELAEKKRHSYLYVPPFDMVNTGKLIFEINEYHLNRKRWRDNDNRKIDDKIDEIAIWIIEAIHIVKTVQEERKAEEIRRLEEERRRQQIAEMRKHELEQFELLEKHASDWERATKIRNFIEGSEQKIGEIDDDVKKEKMLNWLKWALDKADWLDPLSDKKDKWLGKNPICFDVLNDI